MDWLLVVSSKESIAALNAASMSGPLFKIINLHIEMLNLLLPLLE
jgi:hypothetical protein